MREEVVRTPLFQKRHRGILEERAPRSLCRGGDERRFTIVVEGWGELILAHRVHTYEYDLVAGRWCETTRRLSAGTRDKRIADKLRLPPAAGSVLPSTTSLLEQQPRSPSSRRGAYCGVVWEGGRANIQGARCCYDFFHRLQKELPIDLDALMNDLGLPIHGKDSVPVVQEQDPF